MTIADEKSLLAAEEARRQAMLAGDVAKLDALLSDALVYVHSSGGVDSKQSYLDKLARGVMRYETLEFIAPQARLIGQAGLLNARMRARVENAGARREVASSYLAVWEHGATGWVLQWVQATSLPPA